MPFSNWLHVIAIGGCLIAVLLTPFSVQGQEPPQPDTNPTQGQASGNAPIVPNAAFWRSLFDEAVERLAKEKASNEPSENRKEARETEDLAAQKDMARWAEWMAFFAMIQLPLSVATLWFLYKTFGESKRTADAGVKAAEAAERALVDLERPHVFIEVQEPGLLRAAAGQILGASLLEYKIFNYGRTPAMLTELKEVFVIIPRDRAQKLPDPIDPNITPGRTFPVGVVAGAEKPYRLTVNLAAELDFAHLSTPKGRLDHVFFIGYLRFADIFGKRHITGFCLLYDYSGSRFVPMGDERYNYARQES